MKRLLLTIIAALTLCGATAGNRYEISFDMRRLAAKLELTDAQMESFAVVQDNFNTAVAQAGETPRFVRHRIIRRALMTDARDMHRVLTDEQFRTYMTLLVTTLRNSHLLF